MSSPFRARAVALVATVLLLGVAATACGSDSKDDAKGTTTTTRAPAGGDGTTTTGGKDTTRTTVKTGNQNPDVPKVSGAEQPFVDALASTYDAETDDTFSKQQVQCLAATWVPIIGVDTLKAQGITPEKLAQADSDITDLNLDEPTARKMVESMPTCGIDLAETLLAGMQSSTTPEQAACIKDAIDPKAIEDAMIASFQGDDGDMESAFAGAEKCLTPTGMDPTSTTN